MMMMMMMINDTNWYRLMMINEKHMFIKPQTWCWLIVGFEMVWGNKKNGRSNQHLTHSRRYKEQLGILLLISTYNIHVGALICLKLQCFLHVSKTTTRFQCSGGPNPAIHSLDTNEFGESLHWKESRTHQLYGVSENLYGVWMIYSPTLGHQHFPKTYGVWMIFPAGLSQCLALPPFRPGTEPPFALRRLKNVGAAAGLTQAEDGTPRARHQQCLAMSGGSPQWSLSVSEPIWLWWAHGCRHGFPRSPWNIWNSCSVSKNVYHFYRCVFAIMNKPT